MTEPVPNLMDDLDEEYDAQLPIVDLLHFEKDIDSYVITFVPSDEVSREQKEMVVIRKNTADGRHITVWLAELSKLIGGGRTIDLISHSGGDAFSFRFTDGKTHELQDLQLSKDVANQRAFDRLQYLALVAETAFRIEMVSARRAS